MLYEVITTYAIVVAITLVSTAPHIALTQKWMVTLMIAQTRASAEIPRTSCQMSMASTLWALGTTNSQTVHAVPATIIPRLMSDFFSVGIIDPFLSCY